MFKQRHPKLSNSVAKLILTTTIIVFLLPLNILHAQDFVDQPLATANINDQPNRADWSYDSLYIAVAAMDGLYIYTDALQEITQIHSEQAIYAVDWHPSLPKLAITYRNTVEIYDWDEAAEELTVDHVISFSKTIFFTSWNVDGTRLAIAEIVHQSEFQTGNEVVQISIWDGTNYEHFTTLPKKYLVSISFPFADYFEWSPNNPALFGGVGYEVQILQDGNLLAETDNIVYIVDTETGKNVQEMPVGVGPTGYGFALQPNGTLVAVGAEPGTSLFELETGQFIAPLGGNHFDVYSLSWSPNGRYLASEQSVFDTHDFSRLGTFLATDVRNVSWSPDGNQILIVNRDGQLTTQDPALLPDYTTD